MRGARCDYDIRLLVELAKDPVPERLPGPSCGHVLERSFPVPQRPRAAHNHDGPVPFRKLELGVCVLEVLHGPPVEIPFVPSHPLTAAVRERELVVEQLVPITSDVDFVPVRLAAQPFQALLHFHKGAGVGEAAGVDEDVPRW